MLDFVNGEGAAVVPGAPAVPEMEEPEDDGSLAEVLRIPLRGGIRTDGPLGILEEEEAAPAREGVDLEGESVG